MKRFSHLIVVLVWGLLVSCGQSPQNADPTPTSVGKPDQGFDVGGAGDSFAGEFVQIGYELVELFRARPVPGIAEDAFYETVKNAHVSSEETLVLRGETVDAINYASASPKQIVINRTRWSQLKLLRYEKVLLTLHEYLSVQGIDDSNYQVSRKIDRARVCDRTPAIREALEKLFKKSCYRIVADDLFFIEKLQLDGIPITDIRSGDFDLLHSLTYLSLRKSGIEKIALGAFKDLRALRVLDLTENLLSNLKPHQFEGLSNLTALRLVNNEIHHLDTDALSGLSHIEHITTNRTPEAEEMDHAALAFNDVRTIYLYYNNIQKLAEGFLNGLNIKTVGIWFGGQCFIKGLSFCSEEKK